LVKVLLLTSYERMIRYLSAINGSSLTDTRGQQQMIVNWIATASKQIENHLKRWLKIDSYTEYYDTLKGNEVSLLVRGFPITTLSDVYCDPEGKYDGGEFEIENCIPNARNSGFVLPYAPPAKGYKTIRVRYMGGMAYHGTRSIFTCDITGTWNVGNFAIGGTSGAVGIIKVVTLMTLTIEILYGIFELSETITEYTDEGITTIGDATAEITVITQQSLVEQYPDIVRACEMQVRYYWKHKDDFELESTNRDATNRKISERRPTPLTDETMAMLEPYRRLSI
jgi:hypothetical protein